MTFMMADGSDPDRMSWSAFCDFLSRSSLFTNVLFIVYI